MTKGLDPRRRPRSVGLKAHRRIRENERNWRINSTLVAAAVFSSVGIPVGAVLTAPIAYERFVDGPFPAEGILFLQLLTFFPAVALGSWLHGVLLRAARPPEG